MPSIDSSSASEDTIQQDRSGMSRRSVVRTGVAAAWAVPLVQVAAAAPSFAASGPADLSTSTMGAFTRSGKSGSLPTLTVKNTNTQPTVALTLTITCTGNTFDTTPTATGWTGTPVVAATSSVTLVRNTPVNGNTTAAAVTVSVHFSNAAVTTVNATLTTTGGTGKSFGNMSN